MEPKKLYFHNGGFYGLPFYIGAIRELARDPPHGEIHYYCNSAGVFGAVGCYLVMNGYITIYQLQSKLYETMDKIDTITFPITTAMFNIIESFVSYWPADLAVRVSGIVHIGVSTKTQHKFISEFNTNADLYNVLMCSGTIPIASNYKSIIDDEVYLDGGYTFDENLVPKNSTIIAWTCPIALTCPPRFIYPWIEEKGRRNVVYGQQNPLINHYTEESELKILFMIYAWCNKDPTYEQKIEYLTKSKITRLTMDE
jgi:hypothetical protein